MTTDRDPAFKLEASKEDGIQLRVPLRRPTRGRRARATRTSPARWPTVPTRSRRAPWTRSGADETPAKRSFVVDTAAPNTTLSSGPRGLIRDNRPGFFFGSSEAGSRFECNLGGAWFACEAPTYRPSALADGEYTFAVRAIDAAGNADPTPASVTFTIDTTPPVTVIDGVTAKLLGSGAQRGADRAGRRLVRGPGRGRRGRAGRLLPGERPGLRGRRRPRHDAPASAAQVKAAPENTITLARTEFSAQPGQTVRRPAAPLDGRPQPGRPDREDGRVHHAGPRQRPDAAWRGRRAHARPAHRAAAGRGQRAALQAAARSSSGSPAPPPARARSRSPTARP